VLVDIMVVEKGLASLKALGFLRFAMVILIFLFISDLPNYTCLPDFLGVHRER
jgi:hypothetical protein